MIDLPRGNELHPDGVANRSFPVVRRGFDQDDVRRFLEDVSSQLRQVLATEAELRSLLDEAERRAAHPDLDEATLSAAVGSETARVLQVAHEAAHEVLARAETRAAEMRGEAERALGERTTEAEGRAEEILAAAREAARTVTEAAREDCRAMVEEAREARRRILEDLTERRRALHVQLEQLRAGKDALARIVDGVVESISDVRSRIFGAEEEAQSAAGEAVVDGAELELGDGVSVEFGEVAVKVLGPDFTDAQQETGGTVRDTGTPALEETATAAAEEGITPVDALFARLRAEGEPLEATRSSGDAVAAAVTAVLEAAAEPTEPPAEVAPTTAATPEADATAEEVEPEGDRVLLDRRNELISEPVAALVRAMKRILASEQNELLDALRNLPPREDPLGLLAGESARARIREAAGPNLAEAFEAGATFALGEISSASAIPKRARADGERAMASAERVAGELAGTIVDAIHRRVTEGDTSDDPEGGLAPLIGVAFREWKGARIEATVGDSVVRSFSLGVAEIARTRKVPVRWLVDDGSTPCPDCDDNGLTAPQAVDEAFPTGQHEPPVHPGCRCVLVPVST